MNTIIPGMLMRDGGTVAPFGVMGGHYQAMGHVELLTGIIDRGLDVQEALDVPRSFAHDGVLELEPCISAEVETELQKRGHRHAPMRSRSAAARSSGRPAKRYADRGLGLPQGRQRCRVLV